MVRELIREETRNAERSYDGVVYPFTLDELHDYCGRTRDARL
jgi:hypothetical protein